MTTDVRPSRNHRSAAVVLVLSVLLAACGGKTVEERVAAAEEALEAGQVRTAEVEARSALQDAPDNGQARLLRGLASLALGDFDTAESDFERARSLGVTDARLVEGLLGLYLVQGRAAEALEVIEGLDPATVTPTTRLLQVDALLGTNELDAAAAVLQDLSSISDPEIVRRVTLGEIKLLIEREELDAAASRIEVLRAESPDFADAFLLSGLIAQQRGDLDNAAKYFTNAAGLLEAAGQRNRAAETWFRSAVSHLTNGTLESGEASIEKFSGLVGESPATSYLRGYLLLRQNKGAAANELLREAHAKAPGSIVYRRMLGISEAAQGNLGQSEQHLLAVLRANPEDTAIRRILAEVYQRQGRASDAVRELRRVDDPSSLDVTRLAQALIQNGQNDAAIQMLEEARARGETDRVANLLLARGYATTGRESEAEALLQGMVEQDDEDYLAFTSLVQTYLVRGDTTGARRLTDDLLEERPDDLRSYRVATSFLYSVGETDDAMATARAAVEQFPELADAYALAAGMAMLTERQQEAETALDRILEIDPDNVSARMELARLRTLQDRPDDAERLLEEAVALDEDDLRPALALARITLGDGRVEEALKWSDEMLQRAPNLASTHAFRSAVLIDAGQPEASVQAAALAFRQSDLTPQNVVSIAVLQDNAGQSDSAASFLEQGRDRFPDNTLILLQSARTALRSGDVAAARRYSDDALRLDDDNAYGLLIAGQIAMNQNRDDAARAYFERAEDAGVGERAAIGVVAAAMRSESDDRFQVLRNSASNYPQSLTLGMLLAQTEQAEGRAAAARRAYESVLSNFPDNSVAMNNLAWLFQEAGDFDRALELSSAAVAANPERWDMLDTHGVVLLGRGDDAEALAVLRKAYALNAESAEVRLHLAQAELSAGDRDAGIAHLRAIVAAGDNNAVTQEANSLLDGLQ